MFGLASPISNLIGWALPAYLSVQAIESPSANDDKQWLTYWVCILLFRKAYFGSRISGRDLDTPKMEPRRPSCNYKNFVPRRMETDI